MKIKDLLDLSPADLRSMDVKTLRGITKTSNRMANRRITSLQKAEATSSFAYQALPKKVQKAGKYSTVSKATKAQLINQIQSQQQFLSAQTSTVKGWNKRIQKAQAAFKAETGKTYKSFRYDVHGNLIPEAIAKKQGIRTLTSKQFARAMDILHQLREAMPENVDNLTSNNVRDMITEMMFDFGKVTNDESILQFLEGWLKDAYEFKELEAKRAEEEITGGPKKRF